MFGTGSDAAVIRRVLAGRHEDFAVLVARHMPMARALAWARLRHPQDVEDVVQESFLKAYRSLDTLRDVRHFGSWLGAIVRNACVNVIRAQQVRNAAAAEAADNATVSPAIEQEEVRRLVRARLDDLDEASREVLLLHYFAGRSTREIAGVLNLSRDAVKKRMQRARETLGQALLRDLSPTEADRQDREKQVRAVMAAIPLSSAPWAEASAATAVAGAISVVKVASLIASVVVLLAVSIGAWVVVAAPRNVAGDPPEVRDRAAPTNSNPSPDIRSSANANDTAVTPESGPTGTLTGQILNANSREPVTDIEVTLLPGEHANFPATTSGARVVRTGSDGRFRVDSVNGELHTLFIRDPWYVTFTQTIQLWHLRGASIDAETEKLLPSDDRTFLLSPAGVVSGRVLDKSTGQGVAGVEVLAALYDNAPRTVSGEDGTYRLTSVPEGEQRIVRGITGDYAYITLGEERVLTVRHREEHGGIDFPLSNGVRVIGQTVHADGTPFGGVTINFYTPNGGFGVFPNTVAVRSDDDGNFSGSNFALQSVINYDLSSEDKGRGLSVPARRGITLGVDAVQRASIFVERGAILAGRITTPTGVGVAGVSVSARYTLLHESGTVGVASPTDASGDFRSDFLYPDNYDLILELPPVEGSPPPPQPLGTVALKPGEVRDDLLFVYDSEAGLSIAGRIVDQDGDPIAGVSFAVLSPNNQTRGTSDAEGFFRIGGLDEGIYELTYFELGRDSFGSRPPSIANAYEAERVAAGTQDVEIRLELQAAPEAGGPISGIVVDAVTHAPITHFGYQLLSGTYSVPDADSHEPGIWGQIQRPLHLQHSSADGAFSLPTYSAGPHTLLVMAAGYAPHVSAVEAGSINNTVALVRGATVGGVVLDPAGQPVAGAAIILGALEMLHMVSMVNSPRDGRVVAMTKNDGTFEATDLGPEARVLSAVHPDFGQVARTMTLVPGEPAHVTFQFAPSGILEGQITMGGAPVGRGGVDFHDIDDRYIGNFRSDDLGVFRARALPPGSYITYFRFEQHAGAQAMQWRTRADVEIVGGESTRYDMDFPIAQTTLYGAVTVDDQPITAISRVQIEYSNSWLTASTEVAVRDGAYRIEGLAAGEATLRFPESWEGIEFDRNEITVTLPEGGELEQDIVLTSKR